MNRKAFRLSLFAVVALLAAPSEAAPLGTALSYQSHLADRGSPATGTYDLQFSLRDADSGGNLAGATLTNAPVAINNGLFAVTLDFGGKVFEGTAYWSWKSACAPTAARRTISCSTRSSC